MQRVRLLAPPLPGSVLPAQEGCCLHSSPLSGLSLCGCARSRNSQERRESASPVAGPSLSTLSVSIDRQRTSHVLDAPMHVPALNQKPFCVTHVCSVCDRVSSHVYCLPRGALRPRATGRSPFCTHPQPPPAPVSLTPESAPHPECLMPTSTGPVSWPRPTAHASLNPGLDIGAFWREVRAHLAFQAAGATLYEI